MRSICRRVVVALVATLVVSCGGGGGTPTPTSPTPANAVVSATMARVASQRLDSGGYSYEVVVSVRESGGLAITVSAIDLTFLDGATPFGTTHFDSPMSGGSNQIAANGSGTSKTLISTDDNPSTAASRVQAVVRYTDSKSVAGTASTSADVPALPPAPPAAATFSLAGSIVEGSAGVADARVAVTSGADSGAAVTTNGSGRFVFSALRGGTFTVQVSKNGYANLQQTVTLSGNRDGLKWDLTRTSTPPPPPPSLCAPATASCGTATARCNDGTLSCSQNRSGTCSSHGGVSCFICPGVLCNGLVGSETIAGVLAPPYSSVPRATIRD